METQLEQQRIPILISSAKHSKAKKARKPAPRFTLPNAFEFTQGAEVKADTERALRAVAFLLDFASDSGTRKVDGEVCAGLAALARQLAGHVRDYLKPGAEGTGS